MKTVATWLGLVLLSVVLGACIVLVTNVSLDLVLGEAVFSDGSLGSIDAPDVAIIHLVAASLPMFILALTNSRRRFLWMAAFALTALVQAWSVHQLWQDSMGGHSGGANIGLGLAVLASPLVILILLGFLALLWPKPVLDAPASAA